MDDFADVTFVLPDDIVIHGIVDSVLLHVQLSDLCHDRRLGFDSNNESLRPVLQISKAYGKHQMEWVRVNKVSQGLEVPLLIGL